MFFINHLFYIKSQQNEINSDAIMNSSLHYRVMIVIVVLIFLVVIGYGYKEIVEKTGGEFVYALDDAYIHMSMAKNLAMHGVYGDSGEDGRGVCVCIRRCIYPYVDGKEPGDARGIWSNAI